MNRVRNLIGNHHNRNVQPDDAIHQTAFYGDTDDIDDQSTVFERPDSDDGFDHVTLNTAISETQTIGDFQRQGFINRCPHFNALRTMPFTSVVLSKGFYCFPSEVSFKQYINNKRKFDDLDIVKGLGIPLFHALPLGVVKTLFVRNAPDVKIYKFVLINSEAEKPPVNGEFISQSGPFMLYKYLFCVVFQEILDGYSRIQTKLEFYRQHETDPPIEPLLMANHVQRRNTDTKLNDLNLRWYGTTGFASPFGSGSLKLLVLDDEMPSLIDQRTTKEFDEYAEKHRGRTLGKLPIWGRYSNSSSTMIPKKRTLRLASFQIGESNSDTASISDGLFNIPWETEALTCMCMVLHEYESRKDRGSTRFGGASIGIQLY